MIAPPYVPNLDIPDAPDNDKIISGSPEGVVTGSPGNWRLDGDTNTLYVKKTGDGTNTGWVAVSGGGGGGLSDGDYGDVTVGGSGTTISINTGAVNSDELAANAVLLGEIQAIAEGGFLGRAAGAGTGNVTFLTSIPFAGRLLPRIVALTDAATVTPNVDTTDLGTLATLSQTTTIANPTGTPGDGQILEIEITSASSQLLLKGSKIKDSDDQPFPESTTGGGKIDKLKLQYRASVDRYLLVGKTFGFTA